MDRNNKLTKYIDNHIRPYLRSHNGDLEILNMDDGRVTIRLTGACSGCPAADYSTKFMIEEKLVGDFPWIKEVLISKEISSDLMDMARKILNKKI